MGVGGRGGDVVEGRVVVVAVAAAGRERVKVGEGERERGRTIDGDVSSLVGAMLSERKKKKRKRKEKKKEKEKKKRQGEYQGRRKRERARGEGLKRRPFLPFLIYTRTPLCRPYKRKISFQKFL